MEKIDVSKLSKDLLKNKVILKDVKDKFASLDEDHLSPSERVRYLLQQVCERVREDSKVYERLVSVLSSLGGGVKDVCEAMRKELDRVEGDKSSGGAGKVNEMQLAERDISCLMEFLVSGSHLWDEIGIALNLPKHKRDDCGKGSSNVARLSNILTAWIFGGHDGAIPATLDRLKAALASETVGLGNLAVSLHKYEASMQNILLENEVCLAIDKPQNLNYSKPEINYQSYDAEVAEGKSTLLEVQVSSNGCEYYQWSKDGQPLLDGPDFSGVSSNMLFIDRASQGTEGKYSCCVSNGSETVCSDEINLMVIYPPEKEHLIKLYSLMESDVPKDSWPPVGNATFINLALVKKNPIRRCDYYTVRGDVDDILKSKEVVEYEEVFREYREGALVLVEGRPGSGKTTLVHKITRDWMTGRKVLQGAKMVFLITLRLLNFSRRDKSLLDILEVFYGGEMLRKNIEHDLQECGGKGVCFIIDGLDEYQLEMMGKSVIHDLIYKWFLPFSMVIVTSRPGVEVYDVKITLKFHETKHVNLEVIGFTKLQIIKYLETYPFESSRVNVSEAVSKLKVFLDRHPNVLHMCYLPVHAAMICFLFSQLEDIPFTETQIYEQFTISTLLRQKSRKSIQQKIKSLKDLHGEDKVQFRSICKLAFDMIINSQQVVSQTKARVCLSSTSSSAFDLLTIEHTSRHYGIEDQYTFHHLTFQEYLAAIHIAELDIHKQTAIVSKYNSKLNNVWKFYSGLTEFRKTKNLFKKYIFKRFIKDLSKVQCAFESQQVEFCDYVIGNGCLFLKNSFITPTDIDSLAYVLSTASKNVWKLELENCYWDGGSAFSSLFTGNNSLKCLKYLDDKCSHENYEALNGLLSQLPFLEELDLLHNNLDKCEVLNLTSNITLPQLKVLKITPPMTCSHPEEILKLLTFGSHNLTQVYFSCPGYIFYKYCNYTMLRKWLCYAFGFQAFLENDISWVQLYNSDEFSSLSHERFSYCTDVILVNCGIDDEGAEVLANILNPAVLENFVIDFNRISDSGAVALAGCIGRCSVVQKVSVQCNSIGDSGAIALADALVHCSSLRKLDLQGNGLGDEGAVAIAKATESLPNLDLYLHNVNITEGVERVLEHRASTKIRAMVFGSSWDAISDAGIDALRSALKCGTLPALKISDTNVYNIEVLVAELEHVRNIRGLFSPVTDETVPTLCNIIMSMKNLQHIEFYDVCDIHSTCAHVLSQSLKSCKHLSDLTLHGRYACLLHPSLLDVVKCCTNLQSLEIPDCIGGIGLATDYNYDFNGSVMASLFCNHKAWINLHTLNLHGNNIGDVRVLSNVLVHCKSLRCLDLSSTNIGDSGAIILSEGLKNHTSLLELKLGRTCISSSSITSLIQVIRCTHLQHLDISSNRIGPDNFAALVNVVCGDASQILELGFNDLGVDGAISLNTGLKKCRQLVELGISYNNLGSQGILSLAEGLQCCTSLQVLNLMENRIASDGIPAIVAIMESCKYLQELDLRHNNIGVDDVAVLVGGWKHKNVLTLGIAGCFGFGDHESALLKGERCCSSCDHLLELYYCNDYITISFYVACIPKLKKNSNVGGKSLFVVLSNIITSPFRHKI